MAILNTRLMSHPLNYVTIVVMALLAGVGGHLFLSLLGIEPGGKPAPGQTSSAWESMPAGQAPGEERAGAISPQSASLASNSNM